MKTDTKMATNIYIRGKKSLSKLSKNTESLTVDPVMMAAVILKNIKNRNVNSFSSFCLIVNIFISLIKVRIKFIAIKCTLYLGKNWYVSLISRLILYN